jgi:hypothetical protein
MTTQYSASTLDVNASYMGEHFSCEITNISWNGEIFNGQIDGIAINGTDINGQITASGSYLGNNYTATGTVYGWN